MAAFTTGGAGSSGARAAVLAPPTGLTVTGQSCTPTYSGATTISYRNGVIDSAADAVTVARPAGTVTGDLLIAAFTIRSHATSIITAPSGWTLVRLDIYGGKNFQTGIWYHQAAADDPSGWTWSAATSGINAILAIAAYAGASGVNTHNGGIQASVSVVAPSVTPSVSGTRLVGFFSINQNVTMSSVPGMSTRLQTETTGSIVELELTDEGAYGTTATGTRVATLSSSKESIGQLLALTPAVAPTASTISYQTGTTVAGAASTVVSLPAGITVGDLLLVGYGKRKSTATITTPAGWNLLGTVTQYGGDYQQGVYWRIATSTDVAGKTYDWVSSDANNAALALLVYRGVDQSAPVVTASSQVNSGSTTITAPSVTPSRADTRLVGVFGGQGNRTVTAGATGMTTRQNITTDGAGGGAEQLTIEAEDQRWPEANTATGDRVVTESGNTRGVGSLVALKAEAYPLAALSWTATTSTYAGGYRLGRSVGGTETVATELTPSTLTSYVLGSANRLAAGVTYTANLQTRASNWLSTAATTSFTAISTC